MEQEKNMKREREDANYDEKQSTKKQDIYGLNFNMNMEEVVQDNGSKTWEWDSTHLALGVFDFPWLKDGVVSKSEDYNYLDFEDEFSAVKAAASIDFSEEGYCLSETPEASIVHIPEEELGENVWKPFENNGLELETEGLDCIWASLLNQPLQQHQQNGGTRV
ncbi:hypothetical protein O6P43_012075 [Quillaja saponaria]|uniref:Uncharacterized protein n=1 Tax=Quillaja saponaria TaxID=32244 RepID=A0AAD7M0T6_QUISA|nr:hypothetical protein O6P43_012075 [Quillaja saponaria]